MPTALRTDEAFFALGSIALLAIFPLRQSPDYKPGKVPGDEPKAREKNNSREGQRFKSQEPLSQRADCFVHPCSRGELLTAGSNRQRCGSPGKNDGRGSRRRFPCADISGQS